MPLRAPRTPRTPRRSLRDPYQLDTRRTGGTGGGRAEGRKGGEGGCREKFANRAATGPNGITLLPSLRRRRRLVTRLRCNYIAHVSPVAVRRCDFHVCGCWTKCGGTPPASLDWMARCCGAVRLDVIVDHPNHRFPGSYAFYFDSTSWNQLTVAYN